MEAIQEFIAGNPLMAFLIVAIVYAIGDFVGAVSKAWVPSVFVIAVLFVVGYWTIFPKDIIAASKMLDIAVYPCMYLLLVHMGTSINLRELGQQWKVIVVTLAGLAGMCLVGWFGGNLLMEREYVIAGLPPLTGGIIAATMMQGAASSLAEAATDPAVQTLLLSASVLAIAMYSVQGFVGYPLTAIVLKREGNALVDAFRKNGGVDPDPAAMKAADASDKPKKKLFPAIPDKYYSTAVGLAKTAAVALLAYFIGVWTAGWGNFKINGGVAALILGILATEVGFLDRNILKKCGCFNFVAYGLMLYVFDGLKSATPAMLGSVIGPMLLLIVIGVIGMVIFGVVAGKLVKLSPYMSIATNLTALYGFPPNYVLTEEACNAIAKTPEEKDHLMKRMMPQMIVGGFMTVTITSVIIAGIFSGWF